jgi:signal transduction histidine kinase
MSQSNVGEISADARRLQQILWNLVHNAIKFSTNEGRVEIHTERTPDGLQITVVSSTRVRAVSPA